MATLREFFAGQERKLHYLEQIEQGNHSLLQGLWSEYQDAQPLERTG